VIPRVLVSVVLAYVGVRFLVATLDMGDLIMNALALAFITEIDEMLFAAFASRHIKTVIREMQPMQLPQPTGRSRGCSCHFLFHTHTKLLIVFCLSCVAYATRIRPFYWRMNQAWDILCSGNVDFVYAFNEATSLVEAASSFSKANEEMSHHEHSILQLTQMQLATGPGFPVSARWVNESSSPQRTALLDMSLADLQVHLRMFIKNITIHNKTRRHGQQGIQLTDLRPSFEVMRGLKQIHESSVKQLAHRSVCSDFVGSADKTRLQDHLWHLTKTYRDCSPARPMCSWLNMTELRALCPVTCGCRFLQDPAASFFASSAWGCPSKCENEFWLADSGVVPGQTTYVVCADVEPERFLQDPALQLYVTRALEYFRSQQELLMGSFSLLSKESQRVGIPQSAKKAAFANLANGSFVDDVLHGRWNLAPGQPHPRGFTGCKFWTSWEVTLILGMDFCMTGDYRSLRPYCPVSCGCSRGGEQCPPTCSGNSM